MLGQLTRFGIILALIFYENYGTALLCFAYGLLVFIDMNSREVKRQRGLYG